MNEVIAGGTKTQPRVELDVRSLGTMVATGDIITMVLTLDMPEMRADILARAAIELGITLDELTQAYLTA